MNLNNIELTISAVRKNQWPENGIFDIAFAGRSNVGKSSLINKLLKRKALARVSQSPGKTATINFYNIDETFNLVDLPGYGYAKVSNAEKQKWAKMIDEYLMGRKNLKSIVLLVDIRHKPTVDDRTMCDYIIQRGFEPFVIATKYDKIKPSKLEESIELIKSTLNINKVFPFSAQTGFGRDEVWENIGRILDVDVGGI